MTHRDIYFALFGGKNIKLFYFVRGVLRDVVPCLTKFDKDKVMRQLDERPDRDSIIDRVNYYCKTPFRSSRDSVAIADVKRKDCASVYYYDLKQFTYGFPDDTLVNFLPGDINYIASVPSLTKTRPIAGDNGNNVILNFDKIRHNIFVKDPISWDDKADTLVFRGKVHHNPKRVSFFERYFGRDGIDVGDTNKRTDFPEWSTERMPISQQLKSKFVLSLEGNDVASNLKWIMSSRSLAVMPEPEIESWFMEGRLIPDVHYLRIKRDYSDLNERLEWALTNPLMANEIVDNANEWIARFRDKRRERLVTRLVMAKYLGLINL